MRNPFFLSTEEKPEAMVWSLNYGERVYDWWGRHQVVYRGMMWLVTFGREMEFRRRAIESLNLSEGDTVLDLACGSGRNFGLLREEVGQEGRIVGLDYSEGMLRRAKEKADRNGWLNVELVRADAAETVLRESTFDGAVCTMSMSAIPDHGSAVRNARCSLKEGSILAVMDSSDFEGKLRFLNPLVRPVFKYTTNWDYRKEVVGTLEEEFGNESVDVKWYNSGSMYVAGARKATTPR